MRSFLQTLFLIAFGLTLSFGVVYAQKLAAESNSPLPHKTVDVSPPYMGYNAQGSSSYTTSATIGDESAFAGFNTNYAMASPVILSQSGAISSIGVNWEGTESGNVMVALYSDNSGNPGSLLAQSGSTAMNAAGGWQDIPLTSSYSVSPGTYWLAFRCTNAREIYYYAASGSMCGDYYPSGSFANPWATAVLNTGTLNMRVTYTPNEEGVVKGYRYQYTGPSGYYATYFNFYVNSGATGNFRLALYSDNSGSPGQLL